MALAKCVRRCWDQKITRRYWPGDQDDIDPQNPIAKHFEFLEPIPAKTPAAQIEPKTEPESEKEELKRPVGRPPKDK